MPAFSARFQSMLRPILLASLVLSTLAPAEEPRYYKGNTHTHSLWSDGNDFPEMITQWYVDRGYHFLALSDHNTLHEGEKWMSEETILKRKKALGPSPIAKYRNAMGDDWVVGRLDAQGKPEIRLRQLEEYRGKFEKPGSFLLLPAEEISAKYNGAPIHMNAINLAEAFQPLAGDDFASTMRANLQKVEEQEKRLGRPMMVHINHPNFQWALTAELLAEVLEDRFYEVYNGHPMIHWEGDEHHASNERLWDIANTLRCAKLNSPPLFGLATDDSHHYHGEESSPGRGWVMVRAEKLEADALVEAMERGDFYSTSGVELEDLRFENGEMIIKIKPKVGVTYQTRIIGTRRGYDASTQEVTIPKEAKDPHPTRLVYSADVGATLATLDGTEIRWKPAGDELYFRATILSSQPHPNPSFAGQKEMAWTQPFGWKK
jgi:hypothetical protein